MSVPIDIELSIAAEPLIIPVDVGMLLSLICVPIAIRVVALELMPPMSMM